ncbi:MAG: IS91 family transposase [Acidobacteria bacterium]|nr:MAG: IS91 family transposase [Acidobacteriota bacterium]
MARSGLEVADVFRQHGPAYREANGSSMSSGQRRTMRSIEVCRTAALGGHVDGCDRCGYRKITYNSCRDRHCPKCQALARAKWLEEHRAQLLEVEYFHVVFTVPEQIASIGLQNKKVVYTILFRAASETLRRIAADPKHLGAEIGFLAVLHTWGQNLHHHPHIHCVVPGGGLSPDGHRWVASRKGFFLSVRVLSRLFRGLFLSYLQEAFDAGKLEFHGTLAALSDSDTFKDLMKSCRKTKWVVYSKPPFGGPAQVLEYLGRYTHRVAISNDRLLKFEDGTVTFRFKDYKAGNAQKTMTLTAEEFIRRFLVHVLPSGFVRIRHYGFLANRGRAAKLGLCSTLLAGAGRNATPLRAEPVHDWKTRYEMLTGRSLDVCPACGEGHMVEIHIIEPAQRTPRPQWMDSS